jgi:hypothetical protein
MVAWYFCLYLVKRSRQNVITYSAERQPLEIPRISEIIAFGNKGYMLNPETATMMLMVVRARVKAIAISSRLQGLTESHNQRVSQG